MTADFILAIGSSSDRPRSKLNQFSAALACFSKVSGLNLVLSQDLRKLMDAVVKQDTTQPLRRAAVMPTEPFLQLFMNWPSNPHLPLERLRLKAVTLLALSAMLRPSDIAPTSGTIFSRKAVNILDNGAIEMYLHGIKNDSDRDGFRVVVRPSANAEVCPVQALSLYLSRTAIHAGGSEGGVFLQLTKPFRPLCSTAIAGILNWAIALAGLDSNQYSAKNFRPTGTTKAISAGMCPDQVQQLGHWKGTETFRKHYVHALPSRDMTSAILE